MSKIESCKISKILFAKNENLYSAICFKYYLLFNNSLRGISSITSCVQVH